jgi:hypothetical protein
MMQKVFTLIGAILLTMGVNAQTTLKVESFRMGIGEQKTITLDMDNSGFTDAAAFCCNIYIPEGVEVEKDAEGNFNFTVSDKDGRCASSEMVIASAVQVNGSIRVVCFPADAKAFNGTSGAVLNIPLVALADLTKGTVEGAIAVVGQEITNTTGLQTVNPENYEDCNMTVFIRSDANSDGDINITDVAYVLDDINGASTEGFDEDAADANRDGEINITDVSLILDIINSEN